jgi:transcriptional regulator with XRE-family HTH domain
VIGPSAREMTLTGAQVRKARALLGWTLLDLAFRAGVSETTVRIFETARRAVRPNKVEAIQDTLEGAGVEFEADGAARLRE